MGKATKGILGAVSGKVGNLIFYNLNGTDCVRTIGTRHAALTSGERLNLRKISLLMGVFKRIKPFLKMGFGPAASGTNQNYHNVATAYNRTHAIRVVADKAEIDYAKLVLSIGDAPPPRDSAINLSPGALTFTWAFDLLKDWASRSDQVMMMAMFPDDDLAIYEQAGAKRSAGIDVLQLPMNYHQRHIEVYISFISSDRQSVCRSIYLGSFN
jgi:hypothetical protein